MGWLCLEFLLEMKSSPPPHHIQRSGEHPGSNSSTVAVLGQRELSSLLPCPSVSCLSGILAEWAKRDPSVKKLCCWTTFSQIPGALSLLSFLVLLWGVFLYWVISWRIVAGAQQQHQRFSIFSGLQAAAQLLRNSKSLLAAWHSGVTERGGLSSLPVLRERVVGRRFLWDFCPYPDNWWDQPWSDCCSLMGKASPEN